MSVKYPQSSQLQSERVGRTSLAPSRLANPVLRPIVNVLRRRLNPLIVTLVRKRGLQSFAVIHHVGRRSGRAYATPVSARPIAGGFMIPLTFGEGADWYQNLRAAGKCTIRWNGADYAVTDPVIVEMAAARSALTRTERALLPLIGIERFVRVRYATTESDASERTVHVMPDALVAGQALTAQSDSQTSHEVAS